MSEQAKNREIGRLKVQIALLQAARDEWKRQTEAMLADKQASQAAYVAAARAAVSSALIKARSEAI